MNFKKVCHHCGNLSAAYTHNLNAPLANAFISMVEYYEANKKPCNINSDLGLDHEQIANFNKLRHFGIVDRIESGWIPTKKGLSFYYGEEEILTPCASLENKTLPDDHEAWSTHLKERIYISLQDVSKEFCYKQRPEYQEEKRRTLFDFIGF